MDIGQTLAKLRTEKGIYQKELASHLNVSIGTISNYEKGVHFPDLSTLCKLADYFGVTTDYLLNRTNYRYNPETLNRVVAMDYTIADIINTTLELKPADVCHMIDYMELLKLRSSMSQANAGKQISISNTVQAAGTKQSGGKKLPAAKPDVHS